MRKLILFGVCLGVVSMLMGCPINREYTFLNADPGYSRYTNDTATDVPGAEGEGEGESDADREVVEPDVIRRAGDVLYVLNQYRGLTLVDLDGPDILSQVPTFGYPRDLYVVGDRAYVLVGYATNYETEGDTISYSIASRLYVVDVSDPSAAVTLNTFEFQGDLVDSRLVGDVLYAVCAEYTWYWEEGDVAVVKAQTSSSWVSSINVADPANIHQADEVSFDGMGGVIQATNSAIFVAESVWYPDYETHITYVDISDPAGDITVRGAATVRGNVADKFKMDAYEGVLRVVSSNWTPAGRATYITTFDLADPDNLVQLGETYLVDAAGETLFATRFDGPRAYIVTFFVVDPLFVVDLSDPANPRVGENPLHVPGWSTHIEPQGDRLIALGVDDTNGRRVSCSMFDVSDPDNPALVGERVSFGDDWSWSSAYSDVKAFTVLDDVIIVPFSGWTSDFGGYDRLQFISYSDAGLEARGYVDLEGTVLRSFEYDGLYYGVTSEQLAVIDGADLDEPEVTDRLTLAEYVADYLEIGPGLGLEVVTEYDTGKTVLRTVGLAEKALGETEVAIGTLADAFVYGQGAVLIGTDWTDSGSHYIVAIVDCSDPAAPEVQRIKVDVEPFWYWWWWYDYARPGMAEMDKRVDSQTKRVIGDYWWWYPTDTSDHAFLTGDTLVLRCRADRYDSVFGNADAYEGLALVDLASLSVTTTVGLGYDGIVSVDEAGGKLYVETKEYVGDGFLWFRPMCAYYLREMTLSPLSTGPAVNVPGFYLDYNPSTNLLVTRDDQWDNESLESRLRTTSWDGGVSVTPLDTLELPAYVGTVNVRGNAFYVDAYESGYVLVGGTIEDDGDLHKDGGVLVTTQWGSFLDAKGSKALVTVGNVIATYDFSSGGSLTSLYQTMGYPTRVRFGANTAYIPLGYSGVGVIPLN